MGASSGIESVVEGLLRTMPAMRSVGPIPSADQFRLAGSLPGRSILVRHRPPDGDGREFEVRLEEGPAAGPVVERETPVRLFASDRNALHTLALGWLTPEAEWPSGSRIISVTARQIRLRDPRGGDAMICPLKLAGDLPSAYRGLYRMPEAKAGLVTAPEARILDQLRVWVAMGWKVAAR